MCHANVLLELLEEAQRAGRNERAQGLVRSEAEA
jgi:hypothetical protein